MVPHDEGCVQLYDDLRLYRVERFPQQRRAMQSEKEWSPLLQINAHIGFGWIQESVSNQDEVRLEMLDIKPCVI